MTLQMTLRSGQGRLGVFQVENPFGHFKLSLVIIQPGVPMHVRFLFTLRSGEDLLDECRIDKRRRISRVDVRTA